MRLKNVRALTTVNEAQYTTVKSISQSSSRPMDRCCCVCSNSSHISMCPCPMLQGYMRVNIFITKYFQQNY